MKPTVIVTILLLLLNSVVYGQQEAQFSHNMFNNMGINPGFAGLRNAICATALARQQWVGFRDAEDNRLNPETYSLNVDAPIPFIRGGLALGFLQDQLGFETTIGARIAYSYHIDMAAGKLGIGGQVGFLDKRIDFARLNPITDGDPALSGGAEETHMFVDFALGTFYSLPDEGWAGISVSQMRQASAEVGPGLYTLKRHVYFTGGYLFPWPGSTEFVVTPSLLAKTDLASFQVDINTLVTYNNRFWGGVSYRLQDAVVFLLGLQLDQISVGYSYDFTTSPLGRSGRGYGSHEIMLQYCFSLDVDRIREIQRNIRFL